MALGSTVYTERSADAFSGGPGGCDVGEVAADLGLGYQDDRQAKTLERDQVEKVLAILRDAYQPVVPEKRGRLGADAYDYDGYGYRLGQCVTPAGGDPAVRD